MLEFFTKILVHDGESPEFPLDFISPTNPYQNTSLIWHNGRVCTIQAQDFITIPFTDVWMPLQSPLLSVKKFNRNIERMAIRILAYASLVGPKSTKKSKQPKYIVLEENYKGIYRFLKYKGCTVPANKHLSISVIKDDNCIMAIRREPTVYYKSNDYHLEASFGMCVLDTSYIIGAWQ